MTNIAPAMYNYIEYTLLYQGKELVIEEPQNWRTAERGFYRNAQYHGVLLRISDSINFSGAAACYLLDIYKEKGVLADVVITAYAINNKTGNVEEVFSGVLDFSTAEYRDNYFSCKINSDKITQKFQSRWRSEVDLENSENLDGDFIGDMDSLWEQINLPERPLSAEATLSIGTEYTPGRIKGGDTQLVVLTTKNSDNDIDIKTIKTPTTEVIKDNNSGEPFFLINNEGYDLDLHFIINFEVNVPFIDFYAPNGNTTFFNLEFRVFQQQDDVTDAIRFSEVMAKRQTLLSQTALDVGLISIEDRSVNVKLEQKQGIAFVVHYMVSTYILRDIAEEDRPKIRIADISIETTTRGIEEATEVKGLLPFDIFSRTMKLLGNVNLKSDFLQSSRLATTNGFNVRNVPDMSNINITFQKLYNSFDYMEPIGMEILGNTARIEQREFFYQKFLAYDFQDDITDVQFIHDLERGYSEINLGFETSNFGENANPEEYNVRTVWVSPINIYRNILDMVSNIQGSSIAIEKLRRVQYTKGTDRTYSRRGDNTLFFLHVKDDKTGQYWELRKWQDDFQQQPKNVKFPDALYNLAISPMNRLRKFGEWINYGFTKFLDKRLVLSSSTGVSKMKTLPIGETVELAENEGINLKDMDLPRHINETVRFKCKPDTIDTLIHERVNGVPKVYGIFRFEYAGEIYNGYLKSYEPNTNNVELILES